MGEATSLPNARRFYQTLSVTTESRHGLCGVTRPARVGCRRGPVQTFSTTYIAASAGRGGRGLSRLALVLALLPLAVSAVFLVVKAGGTYAPAADNAIMELTTRDVGRHPVLVGLVSRDGWSHPGPVLFYLLAAPYRLTGSSSIALPLGALAINGAAIAGMAVVARRRGGLRLMLLTLVAGGLLVRALGPEFMADVWNPYIPVLCFGFLIFLTWEMTCGETWALPVAAGVGTFCIQTHIGYLPLVVPLLAWGIAWLVWSMAKANRLAALARVGLVTAAVLSVLWLPPLVDEVLHSPGNLTEIVDYFRHPHQHAHTLTAGYRVVGAQFELKVAIRDRISETNTAINQIRRIRQQVEDWEKRAADRQSIKDAAKGLKEQLNSVESEPTS